VIRSTLRRTIRLERCTRPRPRRTPKQYKPQTRNHSPAQSGPTDSTTRESFCSLSYFVLTSMIDLIGKYRRSCAMPKHDKRKTRKKAYELPRLAVGDVLLVGKFKNRKATITGFSSDENNQPVAQTDKGEHKIFKARIAKLMPAKQRSDGVSWEGVPPVRGRRPRRSSE
jgi:hypothetical protein